MVFILLILMILGGLVIDSFYVTAARVQQENTTDAAALAAAEAVATEAFLYADPSLYTPSPSSLFTNAAQTATDFGAKNFVAGKTLNITPADVSFDIMQIPSRSIGGSQSADPTAASSLTLSQQRTINAVQVVGRSTRARRKSPVPSLVRQERLSDVVPIGSSAGRICLWL